MKSIFRSIHRTAHSATERRYWRYCTHTTVDTAPCVLFKSIHRTAHSATEGRYWRYCTHTTVNTDTCALFKSIHRTTHSATEGRHWQYSTHTTVSTDTCVLFIREKNVQINTPDYTFRNRRKGLAVLYTHNGEHRHMHTIYKRKECSNQYARLLIQQPKEGIGSTVHTQRWTLSHAYYFYEKRMFKSLRLIAHPEYQIA